MTSARPESSSRMRRDAVTIVWMLERGQAVGDDLTVGTAAELMGVSVRTLTTGRDRFSLAMHFLVGRR